MILNKHAQLIILFKLYIYIKKAEKKSFLLITDDVLNHVTKYPFVFTNIDSSFFLFLFLINTLISERKRWR